MGSENKWYATVSVEDDGRVLAISKHDSVTTAIVEATHWCSDRIKHTQVLENPGSVVVWDSNAQITLSIGGKHEEK